jgi:tRNA (cytidine56-2'-O)-methyltransferase
MEVVNEGPAVSVLRLGHRLVRDERTSTHLGLVARAFGAKEITISGKDDETAESIKKISSRWGGTFKVSFTDNWRTFARNWRKLTNGLIIHLTMYGENLDLSLVKLKQENREILVVVGAEKVPGDIYNLADLNISIGNQPHSEIAALAVFLDRIYRGKELYSTHLGAKVRIHPDPRRKVVLNLA